MNKNNLYNALMNEDYDKFKQLYSRDLEKALKESAIIKGELQMARKYGNVKSLSRTMRNWLNEEDEIEGSTDDVKESLKSIKRKLREAEDELEIAEDEGTDVEEVKEAIDDAKDAVEEADDEDEVVEALKKVYNKLKEACDKLGDTDVDEED